MRNGAPFKDWLLPASLERVRRKLKGSDDGDRQMVKVLSAVLTDGPPRWKRLAPKRSPAASIPSTSPSTSGTATQQRRRQS